MTNKQESIKARWEADSKSKNGGLGFSDKTDPKAKIELVGFTEEEKARIFGKSSIDTIEEVEKSYDEIEEVQKFNPYHDSLGRFASSTGYTSFTYAPGKSKAHDLAIQREKERQAAAGASAPTAKTPPPELVAGLGEKHANAIEELVAGSSQEIQKLWDVYGESISVGDTGPWVKKANCLTDGTINVNLEQSAQGTQFKTPYESVMHECGHSIDISISNTVGYRYSEHYNNGEFQDTLVKEAKQYIKNYQQKLSEQTGEKVSMAHARYKLGMEMVTQGAKTTGDVSDILGGATKGEFQGSSGHPKKYWTGTKYAGTTMGAHAVSREAFAEMFSASTTNPASLAKIKEVFPESYKVFNKMIAEAAKLYE